MDSWGVGTRALPPAPLPLKMALARNELDGKFVRGCLRLWTWMMNAQWLPEWLRCVGAAEVASCGRYMSFLEQKRPAVALDYCLASVRAGERGYELERAWVDSRAKCAVQAAQAAYNAMHFVDDDEDRVRELVHRALWIARDGIELADADAHRRAETAEVVARCCYVMALFANDDGDARELLGESAAAAQLVLEFEGEDKSLRETAMSLLSECRKNMIELHGHGAELQHSGGDRTGGGERRRKPSDSSRQAACHRGPDREF